MKKYIYLTAAILFMLCAAMKCDEEYFPSLEMTGIEAVNINNEKAEPVATDEPVKKEAFALQVMYMTTDFLHYAGQEGGRGNPVPAHTDTIIRNYTNTKDFIHKVVDYSIVCNVDFDETHPAGSDVSDYFVPYPDKEKGDSYSSTLRTIFVLRKVLAPGIYTFTVRVLLDNGDEFEAASNPIELY
jgi:hypothetical protein